MFNTAIEDSTGLWRLPSAPLQVRLSKHDMVTLTLKKKPGAGADIPSSRNRPLRSSGMRQRPTLAEAQEQRARQAEELARRPAPSETPRWQDERRPGGRPGPRDG